jgi:hypothetical protein
LTSLLPAAGLQLTSGREDTQETIEWQCQAKAPTWLLEAAAHSQTVLTSKCRAARHLVHAAGPAGIACKAVEQQRLRIFAGARWLELLCCCPAAG